MEAPDEAPAFCTACGERIGAGARFCTHCGSPRDGEPRASASSAVSSCDTCGGDGTRLPADQVYCPQCRWLRPLAPEYAMDVGAFMWRLDAEAMNALQSAAPLRNAAHAVSERLGRPWFEASVNGVRVSERQLPEVFERAVYAARVVGLPYLPEVYVSGDAMWDAKTLGSGSRAFVTLGSVLLNFRNDDLLFLLGREMGHARAGHALWRTVLEFATGRRHAHKTIMGEGVLQFLNPAKLVESAVEAPLMAWARHSEITADRAGLLVVGDAEVAHRVLFQWSMKSFPLYDRIDQAAWREQEETSDTETTRLSEWTMSTTPYVAPRLKLVRAFAASETFDDWRAVIDYWGAGARPEAPPPPSERRPRPPAAAADTVRLRCVACRTPMRIPQSVLEDTEEAKVRCPNPECRTVLQVTPKAESPPPETLTAHDG